MRCMARLSKSS